MIANNSINIAANRASYVNSWINPGFHVNFDTNGANRIRQAGRAKLFTGPSLGAMIDTQLRTAIQNTASRMSPANLANPLKVILVTSLAGGTGSGTFNDIAMLVKEALGINTQITGIFYLPDTVDEYLTAIGRTTLYANGYAALKELDYYVSVTQRNGYNDKYTSSDGNSVTVDLNHPLYDGAILVSGSPSNGIIIERNKTATDVTVESIINILTISNQYSSMFNCLHCISPWVKNAVMAHAIHNANGMEAAGYYLEDSFLYSGRGVATASIPEEVCTSYLVNSIIGRMYELHPYQYKYIKLRPVIGKHSFDETNAIFEIIKLFDDLTIGDRIAYDSLRYFITAVTTCTTPDNVDDVITKEEIKANHIDTLLYIYHIEKRKVTAIEAVKTFLWDKFHHFRNTAIAFIKNYGPQALVDLYDGIGTDGRPYRNYWGIKNQLIDALNTVPRPDKLRHIETCLKILREKNGLIINRFNKAAFIHMFTAWVSAKLEETVWDYAFQQNATDCAVKTELINPIRYFIEDCRDLAKILSEMNIIYAKFSADFNTPQAFANAKDNNANMNLINDQASYTWVENKLDNIINHVNITTLIDSIVDDYYMINPTDWQITINNGRNVTKARERFDKIISMAIRIANNGNNVSITINEYLDYETAVIGNNLTDIIGQISNNLINASFPMYKRDVFVPAAPFHKQYIIIPAGIVNSPNGQNILDAFRNTIPDFKIFTSEETDKITCYCIESGNALYSLADLPIWEQAYENAVGAATAMIHMNESGRGDFDPETGLEWKNYPSCRSNFDARQAHLPIDQRIQTYEYRFLTSEFDSMFDKALEYGIVRRMGDSTTGYYYNFYDIAIPDWNYDTVQYTVIVNNHPAPGIPFVDFLFNQNNFFLKPPQRIELGGAEVLTAQRVYYNALDNEDEPLRRAKRVIRRNIKMYIKMKQSVIKYDEVFP